MNSLKAKLEAWIIQAVKAPGNLPVGLQVQPADSAADAEQERLIVGANIGRQQLEGPEAYEAEVDVELRSTNREADAVDAIFAAVEGAMIQPAAMAIAASLFSVLVMFPESMRSDSRRGPNDRDRVRTYVFVVRAL